MSSIDDELRRQQEEGEEQERQLPKEEQEQEQEDNQENEAEAADNDNGYVNGNGKEKKDKDKKHSDYVQKYSETGLLAEAVIVGGIPYFAVAEAGNIALKKSISIDDISE